MMSHKVLSGISLRKCANVLSRTKGGNFSLHSSPRNSALRAACHTHCCNNDSTVDSNNLTSNIRYHTSTGYTGQRCCLKSRCYSTQSNTNTPDCPEASYIDATDSDTFGVMQKHMTIVENFITEEEEQEIFKEIEPYLKRLKYQASHWDDVSRKYIFRLAVAITWATGATDTALIIDYRLLAVLIVKMIVQSIVSITVNFDLLSVWAKSIDA